MLNYLLLYLFIYFFNGFLKIENILLSFIFNFWVWIYVLKYIIFYFIFDEVIRHIWFQTRNIMRIRRLKWKIFFIDRVSFFLDFFFEYIFLVFSIFLYSMLFIEHLYNSFHSFILLSFFNLNILINKISFVLSQQSFIFFLFFHNHWFHNLTFFFAWLFKIIFCYYTIFFL